MVSTWLSLKNILKSKNLQSFGGELLAIGSYAGLGRLGKGLRWWAGGAAWCWRLTSNFLGDFCGDRSKLTNGLTKMEWINKNGVSRSRACSVVTLGFILVLGCWYRYPPWLFAWRVMQAHGDYAWLYTGCYSGNCERMHLEHSDFTRYDYDHSLPCHCVITGGHASGMQWALRGAQAQSKQGVLDRCGKYASSQCTVKQLCILR